MGFRSLQNDKIFDSTNFKAFADNFDDFFFDRVGRMENIAGKGEKCWSPAFSPAFSPFPTMSLKGIFLRTVRGQGCVVKNKTRGT